VFHYAIRIRGCVTRRERSAGGTESTGGADADRRSPSGVSTLRHPTPTAVHRVRAGAPRPRTGRSHAVIRPASVANAAEPPIY